MCGRYTLTITRAALKRFGPVPERLNHEPRYNISPGQKAPVALGSAGARALLSRRWGWLRPHSAGLLINARAEGLASRPMFRERLERGRCLVLADGFYEWAAIDGRSGRQAYHFALHSRKPFAMAGLWLPDAGDPGCGGFLVITTAAAPPVAGLHDRMPVLLRPQDEDLWADASVPYERACPALARTGSEEKLHPVPVGPAVHRAGYDGPDCLLPAVVSVQPLLPLQPET